MPDIGLGYNSFPTPTSLPTTSSPRSNRILFTSEADAAINMSCIETLYDELIKSPYHTMSAALSPPTVPVIPVKATNSVDQATNPGNQAPTKAKAPIDLATSKTSGYQAPTKLKAPIDLATAKTSVNQTQTPAAAEHPNIPTYTSIVSNRLKGAYSNRRKLIKIPAKSSKSARMSTSKPVNKPNKPSRKKNHCTVYMCTGVGNTNGKSKNHYKKSNCPLRFSKASATNRPLKTIPYHPNEPSYSGLVSHLDDLENKISQITKLHNESETKRTSLETKLVNILITILRNIIYFIIFLF